MSSETSNDNADTVATSGSEAHGQAALLLVESLIHRLIAEGVMTVAHAVEVVDVAAEVQRDMADDHEASRASWLKSLDLLDQISASLSHDLPRN